MVNNVPTDAVTTFGKTKWLARKAITAYEHKSFEHKEANGYKEYESCLSEVKSWIGFKT